MSQLAPRLGLASVAALWRIPLFRSGHLLIANSVLTAAVGFGYWLFAARLYSPAVVGANAATISAMMFLGGIAQLNLMSLLLRFLPTAGRAAARMISGAYVLGATASGVAATIFVLGLEHWAPGLRPVLPGLPALAAFVAATMLWALFVMQDNVLVGLGRPGAVSVENLVFGLAKVALLVVAAVLLPRSGIWYSWLLATAAAVIATTAYVRLRALPRFVAAAGPSDGRPPMRVLGGFLVPDYIGSLAWIACTALVPVLVLNLTDARHSAAFALAWSVGLTLFAVPAAFGQSLVAHGAAQAADAERAHRQSRAHLLRLLVPVALALTVAAPFVLHLFGRWYSAEGTTTLRLLALAAVPNVVVALAVSHARVTRRMRTVVLTLVPLCLAVVGLTVVLVPRLGITGAGVAWLVGESTVAGALLIGPRVRALLGSRVRSRSAGVPRSLAREALETVAPQAVVQHRPRTLSDTAVLIVSEPAGPAVVKLSRTPTGARLLTREHEVLSGLRSDDRLGEWRNLLPAELRHGRFGQAAYSVQTLLPGRGADTVPGAGPALTAHAFAALTPLHELDGGEVTAQLTQVSAWVTRPAAVVRTAVARHGLTVAALDRLVPHLEDALAGHRVTVGRTHGDFHPGNVLVSSSGTVCGLIDWSQSREQGLPALDLAHWLLTSSTEGPRGFGARVASRLATSPWRPTEQALLYGPGRPLPPPHTLLLLAWLCHVSDNLTKSGRYGRSPVWMRRTVEPVLREWRP